MKFNIFYKFIITFFMLFYFGQCFAQDTLENILARIKPKNVVQIHYLETRYIGMLSKTWYGNGDLYSASSDTFLKHQKEPEQEIMAVEGTQLYYFKLATKSHYQMLIDENDSMTSSLTAIKAMLSGDLSYLRKLYDLQLTSTDSEWQLHLTARHSEPNNKAVRVTLKGPSEQEIRQMEVFLPDGDRTVYVFEPMEIGLESTKKKINELLGQLKAE